MIDIIDIHGGLGNQMFEYALFLALKKRHPFRLYLFKTDLCEHQGFELPRLFGDKIKWRKKGFTFLSIHGKCVLNKMRTISDKSAYCYEPTVFNYRPLGFYFGCWQSERYFIDAEKVVRKAFRFSEDMLNSKSLELLQLIRMRECRYVSVHVRRGDYLSVGNTICGVEYYQKAIAYILAHVSNPHYIVFSDDMEWSRENLQLNNAEYVDWNTGTDSWQDMFIMSACSHHIIANSTFSWWGAWLNNNPKKIVIAPSYWIDKPTRELDIIPSDWVVL